MPRDGRITREKILDAAQKVVLRRGFAAASVDGIQEEAGVSRGTFFYHFPSKDDLARALIRQHAEADRALTMQFLARAEKLARDPLQQVLIFMGLHIELFEEMEAMELDRPPGCLFASYSYEAGLFDDETNEVVADAVRHWREVVGAKLDEAIARHPPRIPIDGRALADMAYSVFEGAMMLSRVLGEREILAEHLHQFRVYIELLFGVVDDVSGGGARRAVPASAPEATVAP